MFYLWILSSFWRTMEAIHPDCAIISQHMKAQELCSQTKKKESKNQTESQGCKTEWDEIRCWLRADVGQVVNASCSEIFLHFSSKQGYVYRNCTAEGWSDLSPSYEKACEIGNVTEPESKTTYFSTFKQVYTAGYATSLISLITAILVLTFFRKFHCTRNYIHINLFSSFILRASAVFIKDAVLFSDESLDHCFMSTVACKSAVAFFQFSILANYFWLLVEGMYLQTLLALTFVSQRKYFWWYILTGWGVPSVVLIVWVLTRNFYDNSGCWDDTDNIAVWWIIKGPITASLFANIVIFLNVIRILVEKLKSPGVGGNDTGHFMRLAKSTLFLIPLFGMHYTVFAFLPENTGETARLYIELGLGSFQGFVVALLYCFLNGEVQAELKRSLWKWQSQNQLSPGKKRRITVTQISVLERGEPQAHFSSSKGTGTTVGNTLEAQSHFSSSKVTGITVGNTLKPQTHFRYTKCTGTTDGTILEPQSHFSSTKTTENTTGTTLEPQSHFSSNKATGTTDVTTLEPQSHFSSNKANGTTVGTKLESQSHFSSNKATATTDGSTWEPQSHLSSNIGTGTTDGSTLEPQSHLSSNKATGTTDGSTLEPQSYLSSSKATGTTIGTTLEQQSHFTSNKANGATVGTTLEPQSHFSSNKATATTDGSTLEPQSYLSSSKATGTTIGTTLEPQSHFSSNKATGSTAGTALEQQSNLNHNKATIITIGITLESQSHFSSDKATGITDGITLEPQSDFSSTKVTSV